MKHETRKFFLYNVKFLNGEEVEEREYLATSRRHLYTLLPEGSEVIRITCKEIKIDLESLWKLLQLDKQKFSNDTARLYIFRMIGDLSPYII